MSNNQPIYYPGYYLRELMDAKRLTEASFAKLLGIETEDVVDLLAGDLEITAAMADNLSKNLGTSSVLWLNLQASADRSRRAAQVLTDAKKEED